MTRVLCLWVLVPLPAGHRAATEHCVLFIFTYHAVFWVLNLLSEGYLLRCMCTVYSVPGGTRLSSGLACSSSSSEENKTKHNDFALRHQLLSSAYSIPKIISLPGTSFPPSQDFPPVPPQGFLRAWAESWSTSWNLHKLGKVGLSGGSGGSQVLRVSSLPITLLVILCLLKPHPPLKIFPLVLFQFAMWSKCWAKALFHVTFIFENDFVTNNARMSHSNSRSLIR